LGSQQLSIHIKTLLDDLKFFKDFCPRKSHVMFWGSNFSPENSLDFFVSKISPATGVTQEVGRKKAIQFILYYIRIELFYYIFIPKLCRLSQG